MIISLTGFMGCGKSCIGKQLSQRLGRTQIDLDDWIEKHEGKNVRQIFVEKGEAGFRATELDALKAVLEESDNIILSLGGGTVTNPDAAKLIRERTFCIYLKAGLDTLTYNLEHWPGDRPMIGSHPDRETLQKRILELMDSRKTIYESCAHLTVNIDKKQYPDVAEEIAAHIGK